MKIMLARSRQICSIGGQVFRWGKMGSAGGHKRQKPPKKFKKARSAFLFFLVPFWITV